MGKYNANLNIDFWKLNTFTSFSPWTISSILIPSGSYTVFQMTYFITLKLHYFKNCVSVHDRIKLTWLEKNNLSFFFLLKYLLSVVINFIADILFKLRLREKIVRIPEITSVLKRCFISHFVFVPCCEEGKNVAFYRY